jgi:hypothetical protein
MFFLCPSIYILYRVFLEKVQKKNKMTDSTSGFLCPITHELMTDPVTDPDGHSYERSAIEDWLKKEGHSPIVSSIVSTKIFFQ